MYAEEPELLIRTPVGEEQSVKTESRGHLPDVNCLELIYKHNI